MFSADYHSTRVHGEVRGVVSESAGGGARQDVHPGDDEQAHDGHQPRVDDVADVAVASCRARRYLEGRDESFFFFWGLGKYAAGLFPCIPVASFETAWQKGFSLVEMKTLGEPQQLTPAVVTPGQPLPLSLSLSISLNLLLHPSSPASGQRVSTVGLAGDGRRWRTHRWQQQ